MNLAAVLGGRHPPIYRPGQLFRAEDLALVPPLWFFFFEVESRHTSPTIFGQLPLAGLGVKVLAEQTKLVGTWEVPTGPQQRATLEGVLQAIRTWEISRFLPLCYTRPVHHSSSNPKPGTQIELVHEITEKEFPGLGEVVSNCRNGIHS